MKDSRYILLIIGILGLAAAGYSLIQGNSFTDNIIPLICGSSLIYGYLEMGKQAEKQE